MILCSVIYTNKKYGINTLIFHYHFTQLIDYYVQEKYANY
jgi:hypothetical protein